MANPARRTPGASNIALSGTGTTVIVPAVAGKAVEITGMVLNGDPSQTCHVESTGGTDLIGGTGVTLRAPTLGGPIGSWSQSPQAWATSPAGEGVQIVVTTGSALAGAMTWAYVDAD